MLVLILFIYGWSTDIFLQENRRWKFFCNFSWKLNTTVLIVIHRPLLAVSTFFVSSFSWPGSDSNFPYVIRPPFCLPTLFYILLTIAWLPLHNNLSQFALLSLLIAISTIFFQYLFHLGYGLHFFWSYAIFFRAYHAPFHTSLTRSQF